MNVSDRPLLTRFIAELAVGIAVFAFGLTVIYGAMQLDTGWGDGGPQAGYFPFYLGCIICIAAGVIVIQTVLQRSLHDHVILTRSQLFRVARFFLPIIAYVISSFYVGLYVSSAVYLACIMKIEGGYPAPRSVFTGIATSAFFYLLFEYWFRIPLLKGPLEAALGI